ncbi:MAG: hypothetical protein EP343_09480 [Deltaproteobacteria bacterium]|nr:MAG: hypothetical protein EP343_09480 [Deltaproteobacteria bacterium]
MRSWKGDYLHRPNTRQGVTTYHTGIGNHWTVVCIGKKVALRSWKGDYLHRPNTRQGVTTYHTGIGNHWTLVYHGNKVSLRSWKGDSLHRPNSPRGVTTYHSGGGNLWTIIKIGVKSCASTRCPTPRRCHMVGGRPTCLCPKFIHRLCQRGCTRQTKVTNGCRSTYCACPQWCPKNKTFPANKKCTCPIGTRKSQATHCNTSCQSHCQRTRQTCESSTNSCIETACATLLHECQSDCKTKTSGQINACINRCDRTYNRAFRSQANYNCRRQCQNALHYCAQGCVSKRNSCLQRKHRAQKDPVCFDPEKRKSYCTGVEQACKKSCCQDGRICR